MRKFLVLLCFLPLAAAAAFAQNKDDDIIGNWFAEQEPDGTYQAQVYWVEDSTAPDGTKYLDEKNPDKSLRNVPVDEIVLFTGLEFNEKKNNWGGTKIYDPTRGIRANVTCSLIDGNNTLKLRGSVLGIGETVEWTRHE